MYFSTENPNVMRLFMAVGILSFVMLAVTGRLFDFKLFDMNQIPLWLALVILLFYVISLIIFLISTIADVIREIMSCKKEKKNVKNTNIGV